MDLFSVLAQNSLLLWLTAALFGLVVGSFLNVVAYRLPLILHSQWRGQCREMLELPSEPASEKFNLVTPGSRCPQCSHSLAAWENIPVISYLTLRGKCSHCGSRISPRYPLVEMFTALVSVIVVWRLGFTWQAGGALVLSWALIAMSLIDYDEQLLPDAITLPLLWLGLLLNTGGLYTDPVSAVVGASLGYLSLWSLFHLFRLLTGKEGMGYGDFKLLALFGAWLGWQYLLQIVILSSVVGAVVGTVLITLRGRDRSHPIPFGPYLAAAGWLSLLWGEQINQAYFRLAGIY
jgi:leader peptidase (prepilin peptidase)/N-methyltransferase